jgi:hypothetical protein
VGRAICPSTVTIGSAQVRAPRCGFTPDPEHFGYSELTPYAINCLKINEKRCKGDMSTSIGSFLLSPSSEEGSA